MRAREATGASERAIQSTLLACGFQVKAEGKSHLFFIYSEEVQQNDSTGGGSERKQDCPCSAWQKGSSTPTKLVFQMPEVHLNFISTKSIFLIFTITIFDCFF